MTHSCTCVSWFSLRTKHCIPHMPLRIKNYILIARLYAVLSCLRRTLFTCRRVSKLTRICFGFALLRFVIGLKIMRHLLIQSDVRPKPLITRSCTFSGRFVPPTCFWFRISLVYWIVRVFYDWPKHYFGFRL